MSHDMNDGDQRGLDSSPVSEPTIEHETRGPQPADGIGRRSQKWSLKRIRQCIGLDRMTMLKMLKGALAPTIVIAM